MNYLIQLAVVLFLCQFLYANEIENVKKIWNDPKSFLNKIQTQIASGDRSWQADQKLSDDLQNLAYAINQEIMAEDSPDWATPTPARLAIIKKWGAALEPYTKDLVKLALEEAKTRERSAQQSRSLLDFAAPTEGFEKEVRNYVGMDKINTNSAAIDLLYEHRLSNEFDITVLRETIKKYARNSDEEAKWVMSLSGYGLTDGLEKAREILRAEPTSASSQQLVSQYSDALSFMVNLGIKADSLLPDLDALISKIKQLPLDESRSGLLAKFEYARDFLVGKNPVIRRDAKNGSGFLALKIGDPPQQPSQDDRLDKDTPLDRPGKSHSSGNGKSSDAIEKEPATFLWAIIAGSIALLAAVATWLKLRRSKLTS